MICRILTAAALAGAFALACPSKAAGSGETATGGFPMIFDSEWIRLSVAGDSLEVRGTYYLYCRVRSAAGFTLFYPFPVDSLLGGARMVSLRARIDSASAAAIPWEPSLREPGVRWLVPPCSGDTIALEAVYRQKLNAAYARYIVTTTRAWDRPLRLARFEIRLPPGTLPVEFSFPFVRQSDAGGAFYTYTAREFLPDRDITCRWREATPR
jgi:hypothetical protein